MCPPCPVERIEHIVTSLQRLRQEMAVVYSRSWVACRVKYGLISLCWSEVHRKAWPWDRAIVMTWISILINKPHESVKMPSFFLLALRRCALSGLGLLLLLLLPLPDTQWKRYWQPLMFTSQRWSCPWDGSYWRELERSLEDVKWSWFDRVRQMFCVWVHVH